MLREGQGPYCRLSLPLCTHLRDEAEGMDDERGNVGYIINVGVLAIYVNPIYRGID